MELNDLVGKRVLTGVDCYNEEVQRSWGNYHGEHISFVLDGVTYTAIEDEEDGYRSSMRDIGVSAYVVKNTIPAEEVVGRMRTEGRYHGTDDVLELISTTTGKVVLEVGTENCDDYYPSFVASWSPENLSCNAVKSSHDSAGEKR